jgi:diguanylate cyclase (GGDEF) domain
MFAIGTAFGILVTVGYFFARKYYLRWRIKNMFNNPQGLKRHTKGGASSNTALRKAGQRKTDKDQDASNAQMESARCEERESKMAEVLGEMRELVLRLTEIIASTDSASGEAAVRFDQARRALEHLGNASDTDIAEVKHIVLTEIDRMVKSNEVLKKQLVKAQTGITSQKEEIDRLKTRARMDTLTQLANRSAFDEKLRDVFFQWRHLRVVFSLLMMDVDNFKNINDTYGHVHGDRILSDIAAKIQECIRDEDFAARYGGEEFAIVFPDTPAEEALAVGTRIRENVERSVFHIEGNQIRVTISGGISQSGMAWTAQDIIDVADKALYVSKSKGRNRITLSEDRIKESWTTGEGPISMPEVDSDEQPAL